MAKIEIPLTLNDLEIMLVEKFRLKEQPEITGIEFDDIGGELWCDVQVADEEFIDGFFSGLEQAVDMESLEEII